MKMAQANRTTAIDCRLRLISAISRCFAALVFVWRLREEVLLFPDRDELLRDDERDDELLDEEPPRDEREAPEPRLFEPPLC